MAEWARKVSTFALVLFVAAGVGHRYGQIETIGFFWILALVALLAMLGLLLAAGGFSRLWRHGDIAGKSSAIAAFTSILVLAPFIIGGGLVLRYPALTDISTDLVEPPQYVFASRERMPPMNPVVPIGREAAQLQMRYYPEVSGRRYEASIERVLSAIEATVAA